jgi:hypothetical protein
MMRKTPTRAAADAGRAPLYSGGPPAWPRFSLASVPSVVRSALAMLCATCAATGILVSVSAVPSDFFQIKVVDDETGRGVPLVELETVNHLRFVTDSAGRIAFGEPGLMDRPVFFHVRSHGYELGKDGFGYAGVRPIPKTGGETEIRLKRLNIAERFYRVTGEGIYRDTVLLERPAPIAEPLGSGQVAGQDSVQAMPYRGLIYWFWGDTSQMKYPLGQFRTSGATSEWPGRGGLDPVFGVNLGYFTNSDGFSRPMCPLEKNEGVVWIDGVITVPDENGRERLVAHYARMKSLGEMLEQGIAVYNDEKQEFERAVTLPLKERWRFPHGHPFRHRDGGTDYIYSGNVFPNVRVKAELKWLLNPASYEAWSCLDGDETSDSKESKLSRSESGRLAYAWKTNLPPVGPAEERRWIQDGRIKPGEAQYQPADVESGKPVQMHGGSVRWNEHRRRWIMIAVEQGGTSHLGEVWYAEAAEPSGPWLRARKVVTHHKYSFYNPVHHGFFDQSGGRYIYFEGTYTETFSGNPVATPRYDYNQIMYRLDLDDPRLRAVEAKDGRR